MLARTGAAAGAVRGAHEQSSPSRARVPALRKRENVMAPLCQLPVKRAGTWHTETKNGPHAPGEGSIRAKRLIRIPIESGSFRFNPSGCE
ncbi:hypothetical protein GCM10008021_07770 [Deinococcus wulumuqiensis]|uniref:Uncharacterized protein n=1 Tax=Deinococcus wulumuqiensis TaxID=980427 RepID=A0ABQ2PUN1_9DEIO|nr:hypothetical protein GCM10008021_07770 [Deinococcus wulumuqiensis]